MTDKPKFGGWEEQLRINFLSIQAQKVTMGEKEELWVKAVRPPGVRLVIPSKDGSKLLMTKEFRDEHQEVDYRLPGGKVVDEYELWEKILRQGKDGVLKAVAEAVVEEGGEEAGIEVKEQEVIAKSKCGTTIEWDLYVVLVTDFAEAKEEARKEIGEQDIEAIWLTKDEVREAVLSGHIKEDRMLGYIWKWLEGRL